MRINANIAALNASRNLSMSQSALGSSLEKLSSGYRINRAADDAAGLAISEGLRSEIRGSAQAQRNAQDGISLLQTAEGGLNEVSSMLQRMRELTVQAANGISGGTAEQAEITQLKGEIDGIGTRSKFAGSAVFANDTTKAFQVGGNSGDTITIGVDITLQSSGVGALGGAASDVSALNVTTAAGQTAALTAIDSAIAGVSSTRAKLGAVQNRLEHTVANLGVAVENLTASESRIRDTDMATEMVNYTRNSILSQAGTAMLAQANQVPQSILQLLR
ncbi:MAG: flagellin [Ilumatobacteraceae bacterium]|nr:flagellin [Ilumatobacteraceae bacterium]